MVADPVSSIHPAPAEMRPVQRGLFSNPSIKEQLKVRLFHLP
jgi:hypothetical protein